MKLEEFLKLTNENVAILMFDKNGNLHTQEYTKKEVKGDHISKELLNMEYMDSEISDDCLEVWVK